MKRSKPYAATLSDLHIKPPEMIFDVTFTPEHPVIHTKLDDQPDCTITSHQVMHSK